MMLSHILQYSQETKKWQMTNQKNENKKNINIRDPKPTSWFLQIKNVTEKTNIDANKEDRDIRNSKHTYPTIKRKNTTKK